MSVTGLSNANADTLALNLFTNLLDGVSFTIPVVDLTSPNFQIPSTAGNPLYDAVPELTVDALTTGSLDGSGMFDQMMRTVNAHLESQFKANRITAETYAKAYIELTQAALTGSIQYLLASKNAQLQSMLIQKQAQAAEIIAVSERVKLETTKAALSAQQAVAHTQAAEYAVKKLELSIEDVNYAVALAQKSRLDYELANLLPNQVAAITSDIAVKTAQKDQLLYQTANILPAQKTQIDADTGIKTYTLTDQLPAQVANVTADTVGKDYTNTWILPAQLTGINEQNEAHRAKTLSTRSDGVTPVSGAIGKQMDLQQEQIVSYRRDAESKVAKMLVDTWITQKSIDEGLAPPTSFADANINTVISKLQTNLSL